MANTLMDDVLKAVDRHYPKARYADAVSLGAVTKELVTAVVIVLVAARVRMTARSASKTLHTVTNSIFMSSMNPTPSMKEASDEFLNGAYSDKN